MTEFSCVTESCKVEHFEYCAMCKSDFNVSYRSRSDIKKHFVFDMTKHSKNLYMRNQIAEIFNVACQTHFKGYIVKKCIVFCLFLLTDVCISQNMSDQGKI